MKRIWLLFAQTVTVLLAAFFVVATLKPQWVQRGPEMAGLVPVIQAPSPAEGSSPAGGFRAAAQAASPAVVSINTSKARSRHPSSNDPWFRFFFGDPGDYFTF